MQKRFSIDPNSVPIVRFVETLLFEAVAVRASAVLMDLRDDRLRVRYRVSRELTDRDSAPANLLAPALARIKTLAGIKPDARLPGEGSFTVLPRQCQHPVAVSALVRATSAQLKLQYHEQDIPPRTNQEEEDE